MALMSTFYWIVYILASDNTPGKTFARELEITDTTIAVQDVPIA